MSSILNFLAKNRSPFMANVYPYFSYNSNRFQISLDYVLFRSINIVIMMEVILVTDRDQSYKNLFDAMVDSLITAMENLGKPNIAIVITESGWPSIGNDVVTLDNA
eukprot:Gb_26220 [translate_table: standard]